MDDETRDRWHREAIAGLSAAVRHGPDAPVGYYPGWTLRDLAVHVVRVHVMACTSLAAGGTTRPSYDLRVGVQASASELVVELAQVSARLRADVEGCAHAVVWTPSGPSPPAFWRRRMLSESVLHRWDAEMALDRVWTPESGLVEEVIDEFVASRVLPLAGDDLAGAVTLDVGPVQWKVAVAGPGDATVSGAPVDVWRWLNRRADASALEVSGHRGAFTELEATLDGLRPARR